MCKNRRENRQRDVYCGDLEEEIKPLSPTGSP
jgi:hypothetical protein